MIRIVSKLSQLMRNATGARQRKRKLLMPNVISILQYGSEIWGNSLWVQSRQTTLLYSQRTSGLWGALAYHTASKATILITNDVIPIDLHPKGEGKFGTTKTENNWDTKRRLPEMRGKMAYSRASWTAQLTPNVREWIWRSHGHSKISELYFWCCGNR